mmetsp:Transcript_4536/g.19329  ORF Transcript_4536/g.19329 Transcript_4536/m.19329 type:complete len:286 (+) Transcript_4536:2509-3366(+)
MHATAHIDPKTPPSVVSDWCKPYVVLRFVLGLKSANSASVGAARTPLPKRSSSLALTTHCGEIAEASTSFIAAVMALPNAITFTRLFMTSDSTPEMTRLRLESNKLAPSMAPMRVLLYPSSVFKNTGNSENTMHVLLVHRNPQNASAHVLLLSVSLCTMLGNFVRTWPGMRCTSQSKMAVCTPSFCNRSSRGPSGSSSSSSSLASSSSFSCSASARASALASKANSSLHSSTSHSSSVRSSMRRLRASPKSPPASVDDRTTCEPKPPRPRKREAGEIRPPAMRLR